MRTIDLNSWADFPEAVAALRDEFGAGVVTGPDHQYGKPENTLLFRGHASSEWGLETTLERRSRVAFSVQEYLKRAHSCVNEIESVTERAWNLMPYDQVLEEIESRQDRTLVHLPHYDYLIYLRHHGFPSPLLDWTTSPYVAAYFAFEQPCAAERCAVVAFVERADDESTRGGQLRWIQTNGPKVTAHVRHFSQKAWYTTATLWDSTEQTHAFCDHYPDDAAEEDPCAFVRIAIRREERLAALRVFDIAEG